MAGSKSATLFSEDKEDEERPFLTTDDKAGKKLDFNEKVRKKVSDCAKISADNLTKTACATTARCPVYSAHTTTTGPFDISEVDAVQRIAGFYTLDSSKGDSTKTPSTFRGNTYYRHREAGLSEGDKYIRLYPGRCADIIDAALSVDTVSGKMQEIVQKFENLYTGTIEWRKKHRPDSFAGYRTGNNTTRTHINLIPNVIPFNGDGEGMESVTVRNHRYRDEASGLQMKYTKEEQALHSPTDAMLFPQDEREITFPHGKNVHGILADNRLTSLFGPGWEGVPEICDLKSDWVKEISSRPEPEPEPEAAGETAGAGVDREGEMET